MPTEEVNSRSPPDSAIRSFQISLPPRLISIAWTSRPRRKNLARRPGGPRQVISQPAKDRAIDQRCMRFDPGISLVEDNGLERQPLQHRALRNAKAPGLAGRFGHPPYTIWVAGGRRDQRPCFRLQRQMHSQTITAGDPPRRMDQHGVAHRSPLGIERLLDYQKEPSCRRSARTVRSATRRKTRLSSAFQAGAICPAANPPQAEKRVKTCSASP